MKFFIVFSVILFKNSFVVSKVILDTQKCVSSNSTLAYNQCIVRTFPKFKSDIIDGKSEYKIPPLNPFELKDLHTHKKFDDVIDISTHFKNTQFHGFNTMELNAFRFDPIGQNASFDINIPSMTIETDYFATGELYGSDLNNTGLFELNFSNVTVELNTTFKKIKMDKYLQIDKLSLEFSAEDGNVQILSEDPLLQFTYELILSTFNEDPESITIAVQSTYRKRYESYLQYVLNEVLSTIPANELIPE